MYGSPVADMHADMSGGFQALFDSYSEFVDLNLKEVLTLHIVLFVLTVVLMSGYVFFMVLPFVKSTTYETRRIAELISQLPAEVGGLSIACTASINIEMYSPS
jgi:hypothetical protein